MKRSLIFLLLACLTVTAIANNKIPVRLDTLAESVVTATNRVEALHLSKALPVTKIYMRQLEREQKLTFKDMSGLVPNLYVPDYGSKMTSSIYIRGIGARIDNPVLGMYVDGISLANKNSYDFDLVDIRYIEVFRGPQGTLYGRNTMGGLMYIETISPLSYQGTRASVSYGNGNDLRLKLSHYAKIKKNAGIGISAYYHHSDGFHKNTYPGWSEQHKSGAWGDKTNCDWIDEAGIRTKGEWRTKSKVQFTNTLSANYVKQGGFPYQKVSSTEPLEFEPINYNDYCGYTRVNVLEGLNYKWIGKKFKFNGSTAYQFTGDRMDMDQDYLPLSYFTLIQKQNDHHLSQEFSFKPKKRKERGWDWISGASLFYRYLGMNAPVTFKNDGIDRLILENANEGIHSAFPDIDLYFVEDSFIIGSDFITNSAGLAFYHTSYFNIEKWQFEAGLRLDLEHSGFNYDSKADINYGLTSQPESNLLNTRINGKDRLTYLVPLPKLAASYNLGNSSIYTSVARAYKAGGFNTQLFSDILQNQMMEDMMADMGVYFDNEVEYTVSEVVKYRPEKSWNFELGYKGQYLINNVLRLKPEVNIFWIETLDQQLTVFPKKGTGRLMTNAGRSRSLGAEASLDLGYKTFDFNVNYGYTNAKFVKYESGENNYAGKYVPYVPANTFSTSLTYQILSNSWLPHLTLNLRADGFGKIWWNEDNSLSQPFYITLASTISLSFNKWSIDIWANNLTNQRYNTFYFVSIGNAFLQKGRPLTFGATLNFEI